MTSLAVAALLAGCGDSGVALPSPRAGLFTTVADWPFGSVVARAETGATAAAATLLEPRFGTIAVRSSHVVVVADEARLISDYSTAFERAGWSVVATGTPRLRDGELHAWSRDGALAALLLVDSGRDAAQRPVLILVNAKVARP